MNTHFGPWLWLLCLLQPLAFSTEPLSPRIANYRIEARLHPQERKVVASQYLLWHNQSRHPVADLQFHLYLNAFRHTQSTFLRNNPGDARPFDRIWGALDIQTIKLQPPARSRIEMNDAVSEEIRPDANRFEQPPDAATLVDVTDQQRFIWPDDGNIHDQTVMQLTLPNALPAGASIWVYFEFEATLPDPPIARTGAGADYFFVAQWFPKIGVWQDGLWNCHQFHPFSEFFADFGVYDVAMTVPANYHLGATGRGGPPDQNEDGSLTYRYRAEDVHDFAWTTSPDFVVHEEQVDDVAVRLLIQPQHRGQIERHMVATRHALRAGQELLGEYPYDTLTVVDPHPRARETGGMEYPTLFTVGTRRGLPKAVRLMEATLIHEFAHQYFYLLVATNEFEEPWLDEGFTSYVEGRLSESLFGTETGILELADFKFSDRHLNRANLAATGERDAMAKKSWEFMNYGSYGVNSYSKPALALGTLERVLGRETFDKILRTYVKQYRFKQPRAQDFIVIANVVSGRNLNPFFEQLMHENGTLDYAVTGVRSSRKTSHHGRDVTNSGEDSPLFSNQVDLRRLGTFVFPVEIELCFEDGGCRREQWDGRDAWHQLRFDAPSRLVSAQVDPEYTILLDVNFTNNSRRLEASGAASDQLASRWFGRFQWLLELFAL
ncbi:M1 family metallopeptidase [Acanthopleuribacter pedis]|uniref:M1 family metallopeptidase n=1 Tax=Acanthopleuribacter pedis TaxID=442870 RepID=A0A8J7QF60_9BACT|nr:M1 family metallopeptidase [Acanthopleuribacter pedis]MBO1318695.1 M1 family metallopeptidase [Acanthopleuribacter pedis]